MLLARRPHPDHLAAHWTMDGRNDRNLVYNYGLSDAWTVQTDKITRTGTVVGSGTLVEDVDYTYNLQGRLSPVATVLAVKWFG